MFCLQAERPVLHDMGPHHVGEVGARPHPHDKELGLQIAEHEWLREKKRH